MTGKTRQPFLIEETIEKVKQCIEKRECPKSKLEEKLETIAFLLSGFIIPTIVITSNHISTTERHIGFTITLLTYALWRWYAWRCTWAKIKETKLQRKHGLRLLFDCFLIVLAGLAWYIPSLDKLPLYILLYLYGLIALHTIKDIITFPLVRIGIPSSFFIIRSEVLDCAKQILLKQTLLLKQPLNYLRNLQTQAEATLSAWDGLTLLTIIFGGLLLELISEIVRETQYLSETTLVIILAITYPFLALVYRTTLHVAIIQAIAQIEYEQELAAQQSLPTLKEDSNHAQ